MIALRKSLAGACLAVAVCVAPAALAQAPQGKWLRLPSPKAIAKLYPKEALRLGMAGYAVVECPIHGERPRGCVVLEETPTGFGFGEAAIQAAEKLTRFPSNNQTEGGSVRLPFRFEPPPKPKPP